MKDHFQCQKWQKYGTRDEKSPYFTLLVLCCKAVISLLREFDDLGKLSWIWTNLGEVSTPSNANPKKNSIRNSCGVLVASSLPLSWFEKLSWAGYKKGSQFKSWDAKVAQTFPPWKISIITVRNFMQRPNCQKVIKIKFKLEMNLITEFSSRTLSEVFED